MDNATPAPGQPLPPQYPSSNTPQSPRKKGLPVVVLSIIGALLVIGITLLVLFLTVWAGPNKADYAEAQGVAKEVVSSYDDAGRDLHSYIASLTKSGAVAPDSAQFDKTYGEYKQNITKFKDLKALKDEEVKQKYDALIAKNEKFTAFVDGMVDSADDLSNVYKHCHTPLDNPPRDITQLKQAYEIKMNPCIDATEAMSKSKNPELADIYAKIHDRYLVQRGYFSELQAAIDAGDLNQSRAILAKISQHSQGFETDGQSDVAQLRDAASKADVKDELDELVRLLTDKANDK